MIKKSTIPLNAAHLRQVTLVYGPPNWHKTSAMLPTDPISGVKIGPGGVSDDLIVAVSCDNGAEFISMDRYDPYADGWETHTPESGQHVVAWTKMDVPW